MVDKAYLVLDIELLEIAEVNVELYACPFVDVGNNAQSLVADIVPRPLW